MHQEGFRKAFLIYGTFAGIILGIFVSIFWGYKCIYFFISCFFNLVLSFIHIGILERTLLAKNIRYAVFSSFGKLIFLFLFFYLIIYFSDRGISTIFLVFLGLLIAPICIRGVSYYQSYYK